MKRADLLVSVVFFVMGAWVLWQATMLPKFTIFGPGPEFMPNVLGVVLIICSAILFVTTLRKTSQAGESLMPSRDGIYRIAIIIVALFLYVFLMETLGYLVTTFVYCLAMLLSMWRQRWYFSVIVAVGLTVGFFWAFDTALGVPVPSGVIFGD